MQQFFAVLFLHAKPLSFSTLGTFTHSLHLDSAERLYIKRHHGVTMAGSAGVDHISKPLQVARGPAAHCPTM
jgi:hypothetical protein